MRILVILFFFAAQGAWSQPLSPSSAHPPLPEVSGSNSISNACIEGMEREKKIQAQLEAYRQKKSAMKTDSKSGSISNTTTKISTTSQLGGDAKSGTTFEEYEVDPLKGTEEQIQIAEGAGLFESKCKYCHYPNGSAKTVPWGADVALINSALSNIDMMGYVDVTPDEIEAIAAYLSAGYKIPSRLSQNIPLGQGKYVRSKFEKIFSYSGYYGWWNHYIDYFGGIGSGLEAQENQNLFGNASPISNTIRQGRRLNLCLNYLASTSQLNSALEKANLNSGSEVNAENIEKLFNVFNPGRVFPPEIFNEMALINNVEDFNSYERWRQIALLMCESPTFEMF